jgi:hypothetical protein
MPAHEIGGGFGGGFQRRVHGDVLVISSLCRALLVMPREGGASSTPGSLR